jgi:hypothetical protein
VSAELELGLLQFCCAFKTHLLGDPRIILLGSQSLNDNEEEEGIGERIDNDTVRA